MTSRTAMAYGVDTSTVAAWCATWATVLLLNVVTLPAVDPSFAVEERPMESVSTVALVLPAALAVHLTHDRLGWLALTSPRRIRLLDLGWCLVVVLAQGALAAGVAALSFGIPAAHLTGVAALLTGVAIGAARILGQTAGTAVPFVALAAMSTRGVVPWELNVVYNLDLARPLWAAATTSVVVLACLVVLSPPCSSFSGHSPGRVTG
ncbi:MAG: hypothetical protein ACRCSN_19235 [Dermatophilaceae bacterium]